MIRLLGSLTLFVLFCIGLGLTIAWRTTLELLARLSLHIWPIPARSKVGACKVCGKILVQGLDQLYLDPGELLDTYYCIDHPPFDVDSLADILNSN